MQNKFDLDLIDGVVSTQYNDYRGYIAIDDHGDGRGVVSMCKEHGVDTDRYFIYGVRFYDSEPVGKTGCFGLKVFLIDKTIYGQSFDEISCYGERIELEIQEISVPYSKIGEYIKRINIGFVSPISKKVQVFFPNEL